MNTPMFALSQDQNIMKIFNSQYGHDIIFCIKFCFVRQGYVYHFGISVYVYFFYLSRYVFRKKVFGNILKKVASMETPVNIASLEDVDLIVIPSSRYHIGRLSPNYLAAYYNKQQ